MKLFSGKQIKYRAAKGEKITESQIATDVLVKLKEKYNAVNDRDHYYHRCHSEWVKKVKR